MDYKMRKFNFVLKTNMKFGIGLVQNLNEVLKEYNIKKTGIIIDQGVYNNKLIKRVLGKVKNDGVLAKVYKNSVSEPDYDYLDKYKSNFKGWEPDCLVGIGGGSTLDLTKGMAVFDEIGNFFLKFAEHLVRKKTGLTSSQTRFFYE